MSKEYNKKFAKDKKMNEITKFYLDGKKVDEKDIEDFFKTKGCEISIERLIKVDQELNEELENA